MAVASPLFRSLPLAAHGLEWIQPPLSAVHPLDNAPPAILYRSVAETASTLMCDSTAYTRLMEPLVRSWESLVSEILAPPVHFPSAPIAMARFGLNALLPAIRLARAKFSGAPAQALFAGMAAHSIVPLDKPATSAIGLVMLTSGHSGGWPFPRGGSQQIANSLASILKSLGGVIETSTPVESLDSLPPARAVLLDVTPRQVVRIAGKRLSPRYAKRLSRFSYGPGVFKIDWALSDPIPWIHEECRRTATLHLAGTMEEIQQSEAEAWNGRDSGEAVRPPGAAQPLFDATRAPAGRHTAWAYCHVPNGSTNDMTDQIEDAGGAIRSGFSRHDHRPQHEKHGPARALERKPDWRRYCRRLERSRADLRETRCCCRPVSHSR
jgi:phytoene dehydrogenase-like protein